MAYAAPSYERARGWSVEMETKAAAKFLPLLVSRAAEGLGVMRIEDLKICGSDGRLVSARKNSCHARKLRRAF
jgi:hypothetical protein